VLSSFRKFLSYWFGFFRKKEPITQTEYLIPESLLTHQEHHSDPSKIHFLPYDDENLLECARTQWQFGDWQRLAQLDQETLQNHPQRAKLALLAAAAHFQLGETNEACHYLRLAQDWECSRKLIAQILISGTHNSLACANLLLEREEKALEHFHHAIKIGGVPGDPILLIDARSQSQRTRLQIKCQEE